MVLGDDDSDAQKSFRNLPPVHCLHYRELNTYDVLNSDVVVFTSDTLPSGRGAGPGPRRAESNGDSDA